MDAAGSSQLAEVSLVYICVCVGGGPGFRGTCGNWLPFHAEALGREAVGHEAAGVSAAGLQSEAAGVSAVASVPPKRSEAARRGGWRPRPGGRRQRRD